MQIRSDNSNLQPCGIGWPKGRCGTEKLVYDVIRRRLPRATIISITQRPAVLPYHERRWTIEPSDAGRLTLTAA